MSSFLVSNNVIDHVVSAARGWLEPHDMPGLAFLPNITGDAVEDADEFGKRLIKLNYQALRERYGDEEPADVAYEWKMNRVGILPAIKAIDCWLYQCAEGCVPELELYRTVQNLRSWLCGAYVTSLEEYDAAATWG